MSRRHGRRPADGGLATVWAAVAVGMLMVALLVGLHVGSAVVARHRAESAADLAALAGAGDAVLGRTAACDRAGRIAAAAGAELSACALDGWDVLVEVRVPVPLRLGPATGSSSDATARARAGPLDPGDPGALNAPVQWSFRSLWQRPGPKPVGREPLSFGGIGREPLSRGWTGRKPLSPGEIAPEPPSRGRTGRKPLSPGEIGRDRARATLARQGIAAHTPATARRSDRGAGRRVRPPGGGQPATPAPVTGRHGSPGGTFRPRRCRSPPNIAAGRVEGIPSGSSGVPWSGVLCHAERYAVTGGRACAGRR